jgi:cytochrome c biogenesis protein CcmG, thiol:disulfide interchange protein DsbE
MKYFTLCIILLLVACAPEAAPVPTQEIIRVPNTVAIESRVVGEGESRRPNKGDQVPDFSYTMADGSTRTLAELRGQPLIINFWASWCIPCREELPAFQQALAEHEGVTMLAVNRNETAEVVARFAIETGFSMQLVTNFSGDIGDAYGVTSLPLTFFVNSDGTIASRHIGAMKLADITKQIEALQ